MILKKCGWCDAIPTELCWYFLFKLLQTITKYLHVLWWCIDFIVSIEQYSEWIWCPFSFFSSLVFLKLSSRDEWCCFLSIKFCSVNFNRYCFSSSRSRIFAHFLHVICFADYQMLTLLWACLFKVRSIASSFDWIFIRNLCSYLFLNYCLTRFLLRPSDHAQVIYLTRLFDCCTHLMNSVYFG